MKREDDPVSDGHSQPGEVDEVSVAVWKALNK